ncbi:WD40/YVTN/BNR-like repeat-containing protein [Paenibacillus sp. MMO-177]|uniref:WD40/YVTN/BNR-like repeat-containing protein n=1 Tax=Paenibacillus sp. MMO-177 TaxID=3081289 RepID=UPI00301B5A5A
MPREKKGFSLGIGFYFTLALIVIIGSAIWGGLRKDNKSNLDVLTPVSGTHPHIFSYSADGTSLWMGTHTGVYKLVDQKWQRTFKPLATSDVMGIETSPDNPLTIFAAGHGFVKRSSDGGQSWETIENGLPNQAKPNEPDAHYLTMDPNNSKHLFTLLAGADNNLYETRDGGQTWQNVGTIPQGAYSIMMLSSAPETILAATETGLVRYTIQAGTLKQIQLTNEPAYEVFSLSDGGVIMMTESQFLKSTDLKTWSDIDVDLNDGEMPLGIRASKIDPKRLTIITDQYSVYESNDGGSSWSLKK